MAKRDKIAAQIASEVGNLIVQDTSLSDTSDQEYRYIPADKLKESPFNEGMPMDEDTIEAYVKSMSENGLIQPISVYDLGDGNFEIISGHQRFEAWCKRLKHLTIPAVVHKYEPDPKKRFSAHTEANTKNRKLDGRFWCSRIKAAKKILAETEKDLSRADEVRRVGEMLGIAQAQIYRYEQFGSLIPELQKLEAEGILTVRKAILANGLNKSQQTEIAKAAASLAAEISDGREEGSSELSAQEFQNIIDAVKGTAKPKNKPKRLSYAEKAVKAGDGFMQIIARSRTQQEKLAALAAIEELEKKLDEAKKKLRKSI